MVGVKCRKNLQKEGGQRKEETKMGMGRVSHALGNAGVLGVQNWGLGFSGSIRGGEIPVLVENLHPWIPQRKSAFFLCSLLGGTQKR